MMQLKCHITTKPTLGTRINVKNIQTNIEQVGCIYNCGPTGSINLSFVTKLVRLTLGIPPVFPNGPI